MKNKEGKAQNETALASDFVIEMGSIAHSLGNMLMTISGVVQICLYNDKKSKAFQNADKACRNVEQLHIRMLNALQSEKMARKKLMENMDIFTRLLVWIFRKTKPRKIMRALEIAKISEEK